MSRAPARDKLPDGDIYLRDADGNVVVSGTNYVASSYTIADTPSEGGVYYIDIQDSGGDIGTYKVTNIGKDTILANTDTKETIAEGTSLTGTIDANSDNDWYGLKVTRGRTYEIELTGTGSHKPDEVEVTLRDADGNSINYSYGTTGTITWKATDGGKVFIDAAGYDFDTVGKYKLSVVSDNPRLNGTTKNDDLTGGDNKTTLHGLAGNDRLDGAGGNDILVGGKGADTLIGGAGKDSFVFVTGDTGNSKNAADVINDFNTKQDHIDLTGFDADSKKGGNQDFDFIGTEAFSKHAGELRYMKQSGDTWIQGDTDGDGKSDFMIHLDGVVKLTHSHFDL